MDVLPTVWFVAIAALWTGYLLLEGFDLGVGMHMLVGARGDAATRDRERRLMLNSIGPVWDGNEVWLITAVAATFAAFPLWYASLLSTLYLPFTLVLLALVFRAVAIEYRGKHHHPRWAAAWDVAIGLGSFVSAFGIGAALALTTTGLPIDANGDRVGGPFVVFTPVAVLGGLAVVGFCLVHGAVFLALKTDGPVRRRAGRFAGGWGVLALVPVIGWMLLVQSRSGGFASWTLVAVALVALAVGVVAARAGREGWAFGGVAAFLVAGVASIFTAVFPVVLPSTIDPTFSLTIQNAASGDYTLGVMTVITAIGLPVVLGYQAWSYWVFRTRLTAEHLPAVHVLVPAIRR